MKINEIIKNLLEETENNDYKPLVSINIENGVLVYTIGGFYKSEKFVLREKNGCLFAYDLYNQVTKIDMLLDLIMLNFDCWESSKNLNEIWNEPALEWLPLLEKEEL